MYEYTKSPVSLSTVWEPDTSVATSSGCSAIAGAVQFFDL